MNPGSFFREVLESHEFRSSDRLGGRLILNLGRVVLMSDNATLLDILEHCKLRRFIRNSLAESAVVI
jgi:hypothetical protein